MIDNFKTFHHCGTVQRYSSTKNVTCNQALMARAVTVTFYGTGNICEIEVYANASGICNGK